MTNVVEMFADAGSAPVPVAGDWHAQRGWGKHVIMHVKEKWDSPLLLHQGDFGFFSNSSGYKYLHSLNKTLELCDMYVVITLGNHEDYSLISRFHPVPGLPGIVSHEDFPRLLVCRRGARWGWAGNRFLSVGGADSLSKNIDAYGRMFWWKGERITDEDVKKATEGGPADVLLSHDFPYGVSWGNSHRDDFIHDEEVIFSARQLRKVSDAVHPQLVLHGHHHALMDRTEMLTDSSGESYSTRVFGLDMDYTPRNLALLDPSTLAVSAELVPRPSYRFPKDVSARASRELWTT